MSTIFMPPATTEENRQKSPLEEAEGHLRPQSPVTTNGERRVEKVGNKPRVTLDVRIHGEWYNLAGQSCVFFVIFVFFASHIFKHSSLHHTSSLLSLSYPSIYLSLD